MRVIIFNFFFFLILATLLNSSYAQLSFQYKSDYLSGFAKAINGEVINYHAINSQPMDALLVRSLDEKDFIEWETQIIPEDNAQNVLIFAMLASLQVTSDSHKFDVFLNNTKYFTFSNPTYRSLNSIIISGLNGSRMEFSNLEYDRFEDLTGFLYFHLPSSEFPNGKAIRIKIIGETANSRSWFMVFKHDCKSNFSLSPENVILNTPEIPQQSMRVKVFHSTSPCKASVKIGSTETEFNLKFGFNHFNAALKKIESEEKLPIEVKIDGKIIGQASNLFKPVKPISVYLIPHSHLDIGYTDIQDEVKKVQWKNIEDAIEIAEQTENYPIGSRFKWNIEVLWALDSYLDSASAQKRNRLISAVQNGKIGVDGLYANLLTGLCSPEEWLRIADIIQKINKKCSIKIESAMISDVPGWSWSIVPILANSGIKYLSCGINSGDRIGTIRSELGDKPFFWVSPSGSEKILTWVHEQGYSAFHYVGKSGTSAGISIIEPTIASYVNKLSEDNYPFDMTALRYTIGSDNGPPDKYLSANVKEWNEKYLSPKLIISTNLEFFKEFDKKYGQQLPELKGDLTPYWEDGAASSPYETSINRQSADKLTQAGILFAQYSPSFYQDELFEKAWQSVILFDEHTWGSWNSVSEPESDFTKQQWKVKQNFAANAADQSEKLLRQAVNSLAEQDSLYDAIEVINSTAADRTDLAYLPEILTSQIKKGQSLVDENGIVLPIQQLTDGSFVFLASNIPAFGSKRYFITSEEANQQFTPVTIKSNVLENEFIQIEINEKSGIIEKLELKKSGKNLIDSSNAWELGDYLYTEGRKPDNQFKSKLTKIEIKEKGPLAASWHLSYTAPGCNLFEKEIKIAAGINRIEFKYTLDKQKIYTPEAIRIAFPFNLPNGKITIENAFGHYQPEAEQIKGSNKNFFTMNNFVDISNSEMGISLLSPDAPLIEIGKPTNDAKAIGWLDRCAEGNSIYSYLMNNYWHTNYRATLEGKSSYRFFIYPHMEFNYAESKTQGISVEQPLIVIPAKKKSEQIVPFLSYKNEKVLIVSMQPKEDGKLIWAALYNASDEQISVELNFSKEPKEIFESDLLKNKLNKMAVPIPIKANELKCLLIQL